MHFHHQQSGDLVSVSSERIGHPTDQIGHPTDQTGHSTDQTGHSTDQIGHPTDHTGHSTDQTEHPTDHTEHPTDQTGHPTSTDCSPLEEQLVHVSRALVVNPGNIGSEEFSWIHSLHQGVSFPVGSYRGIYSLEDGPESLHSSLSLMSVSLDCTYIHITGKKAILFRAH